ncbi:MAG: hypothetical protein R6U95_01745 [Bacteroidales bacterium]
MKKYLLTFLFSVIGIVSFAQSQTYEFIGTLRISEQSILSYKLFFVVNESKEIEGYTITDFFGPDRTKSNINGTVDFKKNTISFLETQNVYTQSDSAAETFCYVHVNEASIIEKRHKKVISGSFQGLFPDGTSCVDGEIILVSENVVQETIEKIAEKVSDKDTVLRKMLDYPVVENTNADNHIQSGEKFKVSWLSDTIVMLISDDERLDGDKISVKVNGEIVLDTYELTRAPKRIAIPIDEDEYLIEIIAVDEGTHSPNTAYIKFMDYENSTRVISHLLSMQKAYVHIVKP